MDKALRSVIISLKTITAFFKYFGMFSGIFRSEIKLSSFIFCLFFAGDTQSDDSLLHAWSLIQFGESSRYDGWCLGVCDFTISIMAAIGSINSLTFSTVTDCGLGGISGVGGCGDYLFDLLNEIANLCSNDWMFWLSSLENVYN